MNIDPYVTDLEAERAAHRETAAALDLERTERAEDRLAVLAMMGAIDEHLAQLRACLDVAVKP